MIHAPFATSHMPNNRRAFTLVELLVVLAIIGLLSTVAVVALSSSRVNARNATRKTNLVQISKALELYYSDNGGYPSTSGAWRGNCVEGGSLPDTGAGAWIPNFTSYVAQLPHDPNTNKVNPNNSEGLCQTNAGWNCYLYLSNGTDYKLLAHCTPEGTMSTTDPFYDPIRSVKAWQITNDPAVTGGW